MAGSQRWERRGERVLASTRILDLLEVGFFHPVRRVEKEFVVIGAPDWANVLALTPDGHLVLVRQFRCGSNDLSLEIPGGVIEAGEDPAAAGARELLEESGYAGDAPRLLASVHPNPAIQNNRCHFILIENAARRASTGWDPDEEMDIITAPVEEVLGWARSGRITHSLVIAALMHFEGIWRSRQPWKRPVVPV